MVETKKPLEMFLEPNTAPLANEMDFPNEGGTEILDQETEEVKEQLDDSDDDPDINKTVA